jgi:hypothetical protein
LNQEKTLEVQFDCMSAMDFSYNDFEETRIKLITTIDSSLISADKEFILSNKKAEPYWSIYDFKNYPSLQWKLMNIKNLKRINPEKHQSLFELLKEKLNYTFEDYKG